MVVFKRYLKECSECLVILLPENQLRLEKKAVFEGLSSRQRDCLASLVHLSASCHWPEPHRSNLQRYCVSLLSGMMIFLQFSHIFAGFN